MKKIIVYVIILAAVSAVSCSRTKKYSDVRDFINEISAANDQLVTGLDKASNPADAAAALDTFGSKMTALSQKNSDLRKIYPDMEKWGAEPPAELSADFEKMNAAGDKLEAVFKTEKMKIIIKDTKVQYSLIELNKKMEMVKFF